MRLAAAILLALASTCAQAQTEADILSYADSGRQQMAAGEIDELTYYKELYRRIEATPTAAYPFKAENLRIIGFRVDVYEDVQSGKITRERAARLVAEQQAQWEADNLARERAAEDRQRSARLAAEERQRQAAAQDEAQRRALALQLLQSGAFNTPRPYQVQPYMMRPAPQVNCTSSQIGSQTYTNCR